MDPAGWPHPLDARVRSAGALVPGKVAELLGAALRGSATGTLLLERDGVKKMLHVRDGVPLRMRSNILRECLGQLLLTEGRVTQTQIDEALTRRQTCGHRIGEVLVEMSALAAEELVPALSRQMQLRLYELLRWRQGRWMFVPRPEGGDPVPLPEPMEQLLYQGLQAELGPAELDSMIEPVRAFSLAPSDRARTLAARIDLDLGSALPEATGSTVEAFVAGPDRAARGRLVLALGLTGALSVSAPDPTADRSPARSAASFHPPDLEPSDDEGLAVVRLEAAAETWDMLDALEDDASESALERLQATAAQWDGLDDLKLLGLDPSESLDPSVIEAAHRAATDRLQAELGDLAERDGRCDLAFRLLMVRLDDARAALSHPDIARRAKGEQPEPLGILEALHRCADAIDALRAGDREAFEGLWAEAERLDPSLAQAARADPAYRRADTLDRARRAPPDEIDAAWRRVLELDPDQVEALAHRPPETPPTGFWSRVRGTRDG